MENSKLIELATKAMQNSYSPYSNFKVGACLVCEDGSIYQGCNIENVAYSPSCCAERVAVFKAVSDGKTKFSKIAIVTNAVLPSAPCGVCRQVLNEFSPNMQVVMANTNGKILEKNLQELLPLAFNEF